MKELIIATIFGIAMGVLCIVSCEVGQFLRDFLGEYFEIFHIVADGIVGIVVIWMFLKVFKPLSLRK